ncbi:NUDIX domain-containing protein [Myroides odoratus]|uniref:NUDIX domain-containing protein n=1 Tax=Myroides odoratus TaxID=256 RepID=UPI0039AF5F66
MTRDRLKLRIIQATLQDTQVVQDTMKQGISYNNQPFSTQEPIKNSLEGMNQNEVYIAYLEEQLLGIFSIYSQDSFGILTSFYLLPDYCKEEWEEKLLVEIKKVALHAGLSYLTVLADEKTADFYKKVGGRVSLTKQLGTAEPCFIEYYLTVVDEPWMDLSTVGLVCVEGNTLLLAYSNNKKAWYLPGGKIDTEEESHDALIREIEEELSVVLNPERLSYLTHIVAPAYGEKKNVLMQQVCYKYELTDEKIAIANEIGGIHYFTKEEYLQHEIPVPGVLKVFEYLESKSNF